MSNYNEKPVEGNPRANKKCSTHSNSTAAQRQRLFAALKAAKAQGITTIEARRLLDILHPAGRVKELRKEGFNIQTIWTWQPTDAGKLHRVARYVLLASTAKPEFLRTIKKSEVRHEHI